jgi:hypothetical protein
MSLASDRPAGSSALPRRSPSFVVLICFAAIVFDGYDTRARRVIRTS